MTTSGSAYTALESLLLFQCLHAYGVGTAVFGSISDLLKTNPDITGHRYFQSGRLSPDALRNFYLDRLRRELEPDQSDNGEEPPGQAANPRKSKKAGPALPTVQESLQHQHLIPKLVNKLYASYRNEITEQIRAEEDRYERLQRELQSIQRGDWDDQLRDRASAHTGSPTLPKKSPHLAQKPLQTSASPQPAQNGARGQAGNAPEPEGVQPPALQPPQAVSPQGGQSALEQRATSTPQPHPSASPQPTFAQPLAPPPRFQPSPHQPYNAAPYQNQPPPPGQSPPPPLNVPLRPSPQRHPASAQHPHAPAVGQPGPGQHTQPTPPYGNNGVPQYGPHPGAPLSYQQQRSQYPHLSPGQHSLPASQYAPPPPQAGFMLPPFQVSPQDPSRVHTQSSAAPHYPQISTPLSHRQQQSGRANVHTPATGRPGAPPMHPLVTQARHSFSTPVNRSPPSALGTPLSSKTMWRKSSFGGTPAIASPERPEPEPIDDFVPLATPKQSPARPKSQRRPRGKAKGKDKDAEHVPTEGPVTEAPPASESHADDSVAEPETRSGRARRKAPPKRTRPGSIASSRAGGSVRDRSRSHSILSHTETVAADNESQAGSRIKSERAASVDAIDEESVDTPSQLTTRRRGVAWRRKRNAREASLDEHEDQFSTPGPPRTIVAPRYFARTCAPIMNDIQSHKHASTFSSAVRAKDAEGYYDIIKRPTDLKSIQKAIGFGAKQVAAAASDTPAGSPGGGGGVVELPVITENIPPKSIVNAAQLEKELMRMFVNAVMFNPGEDGVVEDAREMFEGVQRSVSSWRNVERSSGRMEVEDTPTIDEEEAPPLGKRRKI
ncbi:Bromodomain-containing protein [Ampelomyces quisqualis]|uniref:Bromodomain-containing protein n=1 Tax=Ampelomyces quisqualis TaxID=50730 RepID=A0A6A5QR32_AMPQU|nr:Bromodomain-containing protein [Ampelomyces quisqualis]